MSVSMQSLMKNIYSYFDVLQAAHGEKARSWDCKSLHRAYKWAEYCVQVYLKADGKSYRGELDKAIRKLNENPWTLGYLVIDLELLKSAKDVLTKALLQNVHLNSVVYEELIKLNLGDGTDGLLELCSELATAKGAFELTRTIKDELHEDESKSSLEFNSHPINGILVLKHVQHTLNNCNKEKPEKTNNYLKSKISELLLSSVGMNSVLMAICEQLNESCYNDAKHFVADYILETLHVDMNLRKRVYDSDADVLYALCRVDPRFTALHFEHLIHLGKNFVPDYSQIPVRWRSSINGTDCSANVTYERFLETTKTLLNIHPDSNLDIMETLVTESKRSDFNLWKSVLKDIKLS